MPPAAGAGSGRSFDSGGVQIVYDDVGEGPPVVLLHGFASNRRVNWEGPGWYDALLEAGRRVIGLDCRGHGESSAPHDPAAYGIDVMADDLAAVEHPAGRRFRAFADLMDADRRALAAAMRAISPFDLERLSDVFHPLLVVVGEDDSLVDDPTRLAGSIPGAEALVVPGRNHMTMVGDPRFTEAVVAFLDRVGL